MLLIIISIYLFIDFRPDYLVISLSYRSKKIEKEKVVQVYKVILVDRYIIKSVSYNNNALSMCQILVVFLDYIKELDINYAIKNI